MSPASVNFLIFLAVATVAVRLSPARIVRPLVFGVLNGVFLITFVTGTAALVPLLVFLTLTYGLYLGCRRSGSDTTIRVSVVVVTVAFCWLKQYFFVSFLPEIPWLYTVVGLSYIYFRALSLIIDNTNDGSQTVTPLGYFNYTMNFPTLVAGPIQRYDEYRTSEVGWGEPVVSDALARIVVGFAKIIVLYQIIGDYQSTAVGPLVRGEAGWRDAALAIGLYPCVLYFNFAGYTDIVIGAGMLLGRRYPENFNHPYLARNFIEFWTRWHMSLSFWLRDYLYTPLLMTFIRRSNSRHADLMAGVAAYFITFFVIGVWHGSTASFAVYGLALGAGVTVNKLYSSLLQTRLGRVRYQRLANDWIYVAICRGFTYAYYAFCLMCFWASGADILRIAAGLGWAGGAVVFLEIGAVATLVLLAADIAVGALRRTDWVGAAFRSRYVRSAACAVLLFSCLLSVIAFNRVPSGVIYQAF